MKALEEFDVMMERGKECRICLVIAIVRKKGPDDKISRGMIDGYAENVEIVMRCGSKLFLVKFKLSDSWPDRTNPGT